MIIERDFDKEQDILNKVSSHIHGDTNRVKGKLQVHVSDLLWCMRQSFYKKISERTLTMDEVLKFFKGKVSEYAVGKFIFTEDHYLQQEHVIADNGIVAHPDIISHKEDIVIELKQTDKFGFVDPRDTIYNSFIYYVTQLLYYLYITKKRKGSVIVNHSNYNIFQKNIPFKNDMDKNPFRIFSIILSDDDYSIIEDDLNFKRRLLQTALDKKEVGYLPKMVTLNMSDVSKCTKCIYRTQCDNDNDFWENNKINKIKKVDNNLVEFMDENFKDFILTYYDTNIEKTDVNNLYKVISKDFNKLGHHYKK